MFRERDLIAHSLLGSSLIARMQSSLRAIEGCCASFFRSETDPKEPFSFSETDIPRSRVSDVIPVYLPAGNRKIGKIAIAREQTGIPIRIIASVEIFFT